MYLKNKALKICFRLSEADNSALEALASRMKMTRSDFIRFIIKSYLVQIERILEDENK